MEDTENSEEIHRKLVQEALWSLGLLKWKLWPQQKAIYEEVRALPPSITTIVILCARQFGKSFLGTLLAVEDCIRNPGVSVIIVGPKINQTTDIVYQSLKNLIGDAYEGLIKRSKSESRWYIGDSELIIGGFDTVNASRVRGRTLHNIYIEEIRDSSPDTYLEAIRSDLGPALTHSKSGKLIYLTTLPDIPDHPFILDTMVEAQLNRAFYSYTIDDNKQLTPEQYDACVRRCGGRDTIEFRREYLNEIVRDRSIVVVPSYNEKKHVQNYKPPTVCNWQVTIDWGGVKDKTAGLLHTYSFETGIYLVWDEFVFECNTPTTEIINRLRIWMNDYEIKQIHCDAPGQVIVDANIQFGIAMIPPPKDNWDGNVNRMEVLFATDKVVIHPRCEFTRQSLRSGTFNKQRNDFERTLALGHCDALAALMYSFRAQDTTTPYVISNTHMGVIFERPKPIDEIQPQFVGGIKSNKRFGSFKR